MGIMEKKMETTLGFTGFRALGFRAFSFWWALGLP